MEMSQRFHVDHLHKVISTALDGCRKIQVILDNAVREHLERSISFNSEGEKMVDI